MATSEGEKLEATEEIVSHWYDQQRGKRRCTTKEKAYPLRRSKRFTPEQNARLDKLEIVEAIQDKEEAAKGEQSNFGLRLKKQTRNTGSNSNQTKQQRAFTPALPLRSPRIISQEALNAFAHGVIGNPPL